MLKELDDLIDMAIQQERDRICVWMIESNADIALVGGFTIWQGIVWALLHPARFRAATRMSNAAVAIHEGEHAKAA